MRPRRSVRLRSGLSILRIFSACAADSQTIGFSVVVNGPIGGHTAYADLARPADFFGAMVSRLLARHF